MKNYNLVGKLQITNYELSYMEAQRMILTVHMIGLGKDR